MFILFLLRNLYFVLHFIKCTLRNDEMTSMKNHCFEYYIFILYFFSFFLSSVEQLKCVKPETAEEVLFTTRRQPIRSTNPQVCVCLVTFFFYPLFTWLGITKDISKFAIFYILLTSNFLRTYIFFLLSHPSPASPHGLEFQRYLF